MATIISAGQGLLTASLVTLYTVPTNRKFTFQAVTFGNFTGGALTLIVEVQIVTGGTQRRYIEITVNDNATNLVPELINQVLLAGGFIQASGLNMTYLISGVEVNA